jgi:hypothetical protein
MVQMLMLVPMINVLIPPNFMTLLTQYLTMCQITIPFNLLPDWVPNPLSYFNFFFTLPVSATFDACGLSSLSFLYNFAGQLIVWFITAGIYVLLCFLDWLLPKDRYVSHAIVALFFSAR